MVVNFTNRLKWEQPAGDARLVGDDHDRPPGAVQFRYRLGRARNEPHAARVAEVMGVLDHHAIAVEEHGGFE